MTDQPRSEQARAYRMTRRAASQLQTRRRITESAIALHGTLGPSRTSMSAVAEHAGVRRSTLYRHFPDEAALFDACSAHWNALNPPPDAAAWVAVEAPDERLSLALAELYDFYRRADRMLENLLRDEQLPLVRARFGAFREYLGVAEQVLMAGRRSRGTTRRRVRAAIGHALAFSTWRSLTVEQELDAAQAIALMRALVDAAGAPVAPAKRARRGRA
jgi:AcrR family transcriptional regulator